MYCGKDFTQDVVILEGACLVSMIYGAVSAFVFGEFAARHAIWSWGILLSVILLFVSAIGIYAARHKRHDVLVLFMATASLFILVNSYFLLADALLGRPPCIQCSREDVFLSTAPFLFPGALLLIVSLSVSRRLIREPDFASKARYRTIQAKFSLPVHFPSIESRPAATTNAFSTVLQH